MKKKVLFIILIVIAKIGISQDYIYVDDNKYKSTPTWIFDVPLGSSWNPPYLEICIAKKDSLGNGYLMLSTEVPFTNVKLTGIVTLYLGDSLIVKCYDKGIYDNVNSKAITLYSLTKDEVNNLKKITITSIRFSSIGFGPGTYIATNGGTKGPFSRGKFYNTKDDIVALFGK